MMFANFHVCGMMFLFCDMFFVHVGEICESKRSDMFEVPDIDFIRPYGVLVSALFYCLLDLLW